MRKIKEVLRLNNSGLSERVIARSCRLSRSTVADYLRRAAGAGLTWPLLQELTDTDVEARLFPPSPPIGTSRSMPDFAYVDAELRKHRSVNLTLDLLWHEYRERRPDGYSYSQFCKFYALWRGKQDLCMRQVHRGGEKLFVDYCDGLKIVDEATGELRSTQLFVAVWGASNYTFAEASLSQDLPCWIGSHRRAFDYFGCVPKAVVPDCLKSGVSKACRYEPETNPTYADMAAHYGLAVLPARPRHPRDKAKVEAGVLVAQRWILAVLRNRTFFSLAELNAAVHELLERLNTRPLRKLKQSRHELFEAFDRPAALPLPDRPYEYADWRKARVNVDYHVEVERHYYSVPFQLVSQTVDLRLTALAVEAFFKGQRVAAHPRSRQPHAYTTLPAHMPIQHAKHLEWSPPRLIAWAAKMGPATALLVEAIMSNRAHPEQGYRSCLGIMRLGRQYGQERMEAAAARALKFKLFSFKAVRSILVAGLDRQPDPDQAAQPALPLHDNVRGGQYYH
jgi:transposase